VVDVVDIVFREDIVFGGGERDSEREVDAGGWCGCGCGGKRVGLVAEVVLGEDVGEGAGNEALACKRSNAERNARYITWGRG
jgi:hypothetical protein